MCKCNVLVTSKSLQKEALNFREPTTYKPLGVQGTGVNKMLLHLTHCLPLFCGSPVRM